MCVWLCACVHVIMCTCVFGKCSLNLAIPVFGSEQSRTHRDLCPCVFVGLCDLTQRVCVCVAGVPSAWCGAASTGTRASSLL